MSYLLSALSKYEEKQSQYNRYTFVKYQFVNIRLLPSNHLQMLQNDSVLRFSIGTNRRFLRKYNIHSYFPITRKWPSCYDCAFPC